MTLTEAIEILRTHNEWRRGAEIEPTDPIILGEAIDTIVNSYIIKPWVTYSDSVESDSSTQPIQGDISNEYRYAKEFATIVHARCYPESPQWQPLPDLFGLLTQIDNMFCGLERKPTPTDTARAEDVVDLCKAIQENTHSPRCWSEIEKAIRNYAAPIRAELERVRWEKELVMRQLSAANQRIAEMEKQIESNKKALASNGTISGTGTARSSARTNSLRSMYSKRLPGIGK
jgi:hypothetical protein